jgi:hypothetical protein
LLCKACFAVAAISLAPLAAMPDAMAADDAPKAQTVSVQTSGDPAQDVIRKQLDAIRARNADLAFSLTTEHFHERYKDSAKFLEAMRFTSRPLYNHTESTFLDRHDVEGGVLQKVSLKGADGSPVTAIFHLKSGTDGKMLIDSFTVLDFSSETEDGKSI